MNRPCLAPARVMTVALALTVFMSAVAPAYALTQRWYRWEQNLLDLSEIMGGLHFLTRLCGDWREQLWRERMIDVINWEEPRGPELARMVNRFNHGYNDTRQWYDHCTVSARFKIEHLQDEGTNLLVWFSANRP
jgi:uncharacterized protein (TIGR02301 family)